MLLPVISFHKVGHSFVAFLAQMIALELVRIAMEVVVKDGFVISLGLITERDAFLCRRFSSAAVTVTAVVVHAVTLFQKELQ